MIASAARSSGYRFVLKEGSYENEIVKGTDDEVEIVLDTGKMEVRMYRGNMPGIRKSRQYKEVAKTGEGFIGKIHDGEGRTQEIRTCVAKGDAGGLHWIWEMTKKKKIIPKADFGVALASQTKWAELRIRSLTDRDWRRTVERLAMETGVKMTVSLGGIEYGHIRGSDDRWRISLEGDSLVMTIHQMRVSKRDIIKEKIWGAATAPSVGTDASRLYADEGDNKSGAPHGSDRGRAPRDMGISEIQDGSRECDKLRMICRKSRGSQYPPREVTNMFEHLRDNLEVRASGIEGAGEGLFVGNETMRKNQIVGVYEGRITQEAEGPYVLELTNDEGKRWIDADPKKTDRISIFGKMNEDLHEGRYNAEISEDGFIKLIRDCKNEELFTKYGEKFALFGRFQFPIHAS